MNYRAILIVSVFQFVLGLVWYMPMLSGAGRVHSIVKELLEFLAKPEWVGAAVLQAAVLTVGLAKLIQLTNTRTAKEGALLGFWLWLGVVFPVIALHELYLNYGFLVIALDCGKELVGIVIGGVILAFWRGKIC